jgi:hypothetical protein
MSHNMSLNNKAAATGSSRCGSPSLDLQIRYFAISASTFSSHGTHVIVSD